MNWRFQFRWKEELVCTAAEGRLTLEVPMGIPELKIYLPTKANWQKNAPGWARNRYDELAAELHAWAHAGRYPVIVDEAAWVQEIEG